MAKLKLKLDDIGNLEMDGTVEELAGFVKNLRLQSITEPKSASVFVSSAEVPEEKKFESKLRDVIEESSKAEVVFFPKIDDVIDYIVSKPYFEHNTKDLQEKFLGKGIKYRENPSLYGRFDMLIRNAKKRIEAQYHGVWEDYKIIPLQGKTHVKVYRFKKANELPEISNNITSLSPEKATQPLEKWV